MATLPQISPEDARRDTGYGTPDSRGASRPKLAAVAAPPMAPAAMSRRRPRLWLEIILVLLALLAAGWAVRRAEAELTADAGPRLVNALLVANVSLAPPGRSCWRKRT